MKGLPNMYGWVIYNGHLQNESLLTFAKWLSEAGKQKNITIDLIKNHAIFAQLDKNRPLIYKDIISRPNFAICLDKDVPLVKHLETLGIPVFNTPETIAICDNKVDMYPVLYQAGLPIPKTIIAPKIFSTRQPIQFESFYAVEQELEYPFIIKEGYGSYGEQVYLIHTRNELKARIEMIADRPFVFQSFISASYGRDTRIYVVGDQVIASLQRYTEDDFRANTAIGSSVSSYTPTETEKKLAIAASKAVGADFAGVDLLYKKNGDPLICEVNTSAHIKNIYQYTGINIAEYIVAHVVNQLS